MGALSYFRSLFQDKKLTVHDLIPAGNSRPDLSGISSISYFLSNGSAVGWQGEKFRGSMPWVQPIFKNHLELRRQARKSYLESTETRAIVGRIADLSVHTGLRLQSTPVWFLLDPEEKISKVERMKWQKNHEQRWRLYFESKEPDATGFYSGGQIQHFVKTRLMVDGEIIAILRYDDGSNRMSPVNIQFYNPDQLGGILTADLNAITKNGNTYRDGIEFDVFGKPVNYFISGTKVPTFGPNGRRFVIHYFHKDEVGQIRGVSPLAPILFDLSKLTGYTVAELQAAVVNASIAAWVEPGANAPSSRPFNGIKRKDEIQSPDLGVNASPPQAQLTQPGILVQNLKAGEKLNSYDTKRPNVNYDIFKTAMMKYISGSVGIPVEVVEMTFSQNYSASRATLILAWRRIEIERENDNNGFNRVWHEAWFSEEVRKNNIEVDGMDIPVRKASWLKTDWIGISKPDIDPNKTAQARKQNLDMALTTHERESLDYNGSEYDENISTLADENPKLAEINKVFNPMQPPGDVKIDNPDRSSTGSNANQ